MSRLRGEDGVTLIELLVSMTVMGLVMALAGPSLLSAIGATNRLQHTQSAIDDAQLVAARLDRELRSALCISNPAENTSGNQLVFDRLDGTKVTYAVTAGQVSRQEGMAAPQVLATRVGATTTAFTQIATPLRTIEVAIPIQSDNGGTFLLQTTIAGRNAWRSC
ncbi:MAG: prepilin-type N-terminal cleavage/methylation domain-containing protein [Acidimicrobiia bacterium]|nr:prepilin-type N-terminal cleavage/methylation domain-containing protein [Acidimicrobiia bacterium]